MSTSLATLRLDIDHERQRFVTAVGAVVCSGTEPEKRILRSTLRGRYREHESATSRVSFRSTSWMPPPRDTEKSSPNMSEHASNMENNSRYATMLKEHLDAVGSAACYQVDPVTHNPPWFRATLTVDGRTFQGVGRSKDKARHDAARRACERLQIVSREY